MTQCPWILTEYAPHFAISSYEHSNWIWNWLNRSALQPNECIWSTGLWVVRHFSNRVSVAVAADGTSSGVILTYARCIISCERLMWRESSLLNMTCLITALQHPLISMCCTKKSAICLLCRLISSSFNYSIHTNRRLCCTVSDLRNKIKIDVICGWVTLAHSVLFHFYLYHSILMVLLCGVIFDVH